MLCQATWLDVPICLYYCRLAGLFPLRFCLSSTFNPAKSPTQRQTNRSDATIICLGIFPCTQRLNFGSVSESPFSLVKQNVMDPIVKKLLEGKPEDEKYQAIAFSFACLLTGPRANQSRDAPFNSGKILGLLTLKFLLAFCLVVMY